MANRRKYRNAKSSVEEDKKELETTKGSKSNGKFKSRAYKPRTEHNDDNWAKNAGNQLVLDAGRLSFNVPTGSKINWDANSVISTINWRSVDNYKLPGVARLVFAPTYGVANYASDPLNVAARNVYSYVRYANSGARNYDPNDLFLYLMAMDNCFIFYRRMCRIYGIARVFSQLNRHLPDTLAEALQFDYNDILGNLSNFRAYLNTVSAKLGSLCVPDDMPIFDRHDWMTAGVYADAPTPKAQLYVFDPGVVGIYNERTSTTGGYLAPVFINKANHGTFAQMRALMDSMINAIVGSEDCGIISGDIRKAYPTKLRTVSGIGDDFVVLPMYYDEVLRQIQNATIFEGINISSNGLMYQDMTDNILKSGCDFYVKSALYGGNRILVGTDAQPDPVEVLKFTRFTIAGTVTQVAPTGTASASNPNRYLFTPDSIGTEVIYKCELYGVPHDTLSFWSSTTPYVTYSTRYVDALNNNSANMYNNDQAFSDALSIMDNFNYHPRIGYVNALTAGSSGTITDERVSTYQDVDNYCVVGPEVLFNLHNTSLLSLFDIPVMGVK